MTSKRSEFLVQHGISPKAFQNSGLKWEALDQIAAAHRIASSDLRSIGLYISERLQRLPCVHSVKVRVKDPDHLIAKIIRKREENEGFECTIENYSERVTDLVGVRAIHLFKDDWRAVHAFVTSTWELHEQPTAYVRMGDPDSLLDDFRAAGCKVSLHPFGYRSVHYVIQCQPDKQHHLAEIQVRTIFEEGWSEIDHQIRYPRRSGDPHLAEFLTIFNRLAGSADEMGTFIKGLRRSVIEHARQLDLRDQQIAAMEAELKSTISKLSITDKEKTNLQKQVDELRQSSDRQYYPSDLSSASDAGKITWETLTLPALNAGENKICSKCSTPYVDYTSGVLGTECPTCTGFALTSASLPELYDSLLFRTGASSPQRACSGCGKQMSEIEAALYVGLCGECRNT